MTEKETMRAKFIEEYPDHVSLGITPSDKRYTARRGRNVLRNERNRNILELYRKGLTIYEIGGKYKVTHQRIQQILSSFSEYKDLVRIKRLSAVEVPCKICGKIRKVAHRNVLTTGNYCSRACFYIYRGSLPKKYLSTFGLGTPVVKGYEITGASNTTPTSDTQFRDFDADKAVTKTGTLLRKEYIAVIELTPADHDSDDVFFETKDGKQVQGFAYRSKADGTFHVMRCPDCGNENYAMAVSEGSCCWCGFRVEMP